jgi:flavin reductase (DIM6/NTAB) family NADH-FMN oxidoreductase RutF
MMQFDTATTDTTILYKLLTGIIIPRPIGWISTVDAEGVNNLAPFSYFNMVSHDPPCVMFSTARDKDKNKDTLNNVLFNGQFVVNLVNLEVVEAMNATSAAFSPEVDEFEMTHLTPIDSRFIQPKRVKESPIHLECEMIHHYFMDNNESGGACIVIGKIKTIHIDDAILMENNRINLDVYKPVARLAGSNYSTLGELFSIKRS